MVCAGRHEGRTALVTGSTHGIGLGIARRLAEEGASVVINDHGEHDGRAVASELRERGPGDAAYVEADVRDPEAAERLAEEAGEQFGAIDILVNNVGGGERGTVTGTTTEQWDETLDRTLRSAWLCTRAALEHFPAEGRVVNVSSTLARGYDPGFLAYSAAKGGVNALTRALAVELGPLGVTANAVLPGLIRIEDAVVEGEAMVEERPVDPVGREGRPADVAALVAFLAAPEAGYVSGACVPVDGGRRAVLHDAATADWSGEGL